MLPKVGRRSPKLYSVLYMILDDGLNKGKYRERIQSLWKGLYSVVQCFIYSLIDLLINYCIQEKNHELIELRLNGSSLDVSPTNDIKTPHLLRRDEKRFLTVEFSSLSDTCIISHDVTMHTHVRLTSVILYYTVKMKPLHGCGGPTAEPQRNLPRTQGYCAAGLQSCHSASAGSKHM